MNVLMLYEIPKINGADYTASRAFIERVSRDHRVDSRYLVAADADYEHTYRHLPTAGEVLPVSSFLERRYDCIIFLDRPFDNVTEQRPRIPPDVLRAFSERGGIVWFLFRDLELLSGREGQRELLDRYLDSCKLGAAFQDQKSAFDRFVKGFKHGRSAFVIDVEDDYLRMYDPKLGRIFDGVGSLGVSGPLHLHYREPVALGDDRVELVTSGDHRFDGPGPLIFGVLRDDIGISVLLTGAMWKDRVQADPPNDNLRYLGNLLDYCSDLQLELGFHRRRPHAFISYAHEDGPLVGELLEGLGSADIDVWRDVKELRVGQSISDRVAAAIRRADYYVLVVTPSSIESDWVRYELDVAVRVGEERRRSDWIIPVVGDVDLASSRVLDGRLGDVSAVDLGQGLADAAQRLAVVLR